MKVVFVLFNPIKLIKLEFTTVLVVFKKVNDFTKLATALILFLSKDILLELETSNGEITSVDLAIILLAEIFKLLESFIKTPSNTPFP